MKNNNSISVSDVKRTFHTPAIDSKEMENFVDASVHNGEVELKALVMECKVAADSG